MKTKTKLIIAIALLFLLIGTVSAFDRDTLKPIDDCKEFKDGSSVYKTYGDREFFVEKLNTPEVYFQNDDDYSVKSVGDNLYYFEDLAFKWYGYQEAVDIDGDTYFISVYQKSKLSPSEEKELQSDLKDFNKLNNLKPLEMSVT